MTMPSRPIGRSDDGALIEEIIAEGRRRRHRRQRRRLRGAGTALVIVITAIVLISNRPTTTRSTIDAGRPTTESTAGPLTGPREIPATSIPEMPTTSIPEIPTTIVAPPNFPPVLNATFVSVPFGHEVDVPANTGGRNNEVGERFQAQTGVIWQVKFYACVATGEPRLTVDIAVTNGPGSAATQGAYGEITLDENCTVPRVIRFADPLAIRAGQDYLLTIGTASTTEGFGIVFADAPDNVHVGNNQAIAGTIEGTS